MDVKKNQRTDLNVPYQEKEEAKALGAKWDYVQKVWYVQDSLNLNALSKWLPQAAENFIELLADIYLLVSKELCYRCKTLTPVYSLATNRLKNDNGQLIESFVILNYIETMPQIVLTLLSPISTFYYKSYSKTTKSSYYNNHCIECKAMLGDFFMHAEPNGSFFPTSLIALEKISRIKLPLPVPQNVIASYRIDNLLECMHQCANKIDYQTWCLAKENNNSQAFLAHSPPPVEALAVNTNKPDFKPNIIMYWHSIEFFTPQNIPKPNPSSKIEPIYNISQDQEDYLFPWEAMHPFQSRKQPLKTAQQHTVYCAVYLHNFLQESLEAQYGKNNQAFDTRLDGEGSVFALTLTQDGRPLFDSFVLSMSAWALSQLLNHKITSQNWCDNFEQDKTMLSLDLATYCKLEEKDTVGIELQNQGYNLGKPLSGTDLFYLIDRILKRLNLKLETVLTVRVKSQYICDSNPLKAEDKDFLNSFLVHDLKKVGVFAKNNTIGNALYSYLSDNTENLSHKKIDIRQNVDYVFEKLSPNYFPQGRWPSAGHYPLVLSQQFAINSLCKKFNKKAGIFAVNGPPGTGKTTLLRDLIANIIVKRAACLAKYKNSTAILSGKTVGWQSDKYKRTLSVWPKEFEEFSIVVSSVNNGAVENVTYEIPGLSAIDKSWQEYTDYFSSIATDLIEKPAWALIAARLGNKSNRNIFMHKFWYGTKKDHTEDSDEHPTLSFLHLLKQYEQEATAVEWENALMSFNNALHAEEKARNERIKWYTLIETIALLKKNLITVQTERKQAFQNLQLIKNHYTNIEKQYLSIQTDEKNNKQKRIEHHQFRPKLIDIIFTFGRAYKNWGEIDNSLAKAIKTAEQTIVQIIQELDKLSLEIGDHQIILTSLDKKIGENQQKLDAHVARLNKIRAENTTIPDISSWKINDEEKELSSPWADDEWNKARTILFLEAINLHKAFIKNNAQIFRKNLHAMMDILGGSVPSHVPLEGVKAAWLTLFFVIPVISTTFASFDRLFKHLGQEDLGWLLIDEAGQAPPQAAVGAIWRSQKVVVVGDPLQLEPIVLLPLTAQQALKNHFNIDNEWVPKWTSVQMLADRVTSVGTFLPYKDDNLLWVGSPLRVHRRCDNPMFSIVNKIAYDGLMVYGTTKRPALSLLESTWIPVVSQTAEGHFIPEEAKTLRILLDYIIQSNFSPKDIFVISPFKQIIQEITFLKYFYPDLNIGTIHTTQGKEADIVILILGGNPKSTGAKKWASENSNLLNVAISRAKRRLYVIGNKTSWQEFNYFDQMALDLPALHESYKDLFALSPNILEHES